jgi:phosphate transport system permease protein
VGLVDAGGDDSPVVIVATEESLRALPKACAKQASRGATKLQTIIKSFCLRRCGILTGAILSIGRAAEVAPILMTGAAYYLASLPKSPTDQFMDLAYHVYILSTQSVNIEQTKPLLYATVVVLLFLTFALNIVAVLIRARMRRKMRSLH